MQSSVEAFAGNTPGADFRSAQCVSVGLLTLYTPHISAKGLDRLRIAGLAVFFLTSWAVRPLRFFRLIRAVITDRQESRLDKSLVEMKRRVIRTWKGKPGLQLGEINPH